MAKQNEKLNKPVSEKRSNPGVIPVEKKSFEDELKDVNAKLIEAQKANLVLREKELKAAEDALEEAADAEPIKVTSITPNMLGDAQKTVKDMKGVDVPKSISSLEKGYYHLLCVVSEADLKTKKFTFSTRHVKFSVQGYEKHKMSYGGVAEEDWIMFHNPIKK